MTVITFAFCSLRSKRLVEWKLYSIVVDITAHRRLYVPVPSEQRVLWRRYIDWLGRDSSS